MTPMTFDAYLQIPDDVLVSEVGGESVLLDLKSERYFGLDETGTNIFTHLTRAGSIQQGYEELLDEYEVDAQQLQQDITTLVEKLCNCGLVEVVPAPAA